MREWSRGRRGSALTATAGLLLLLGGGLWWVHSARGEHVSTSVPVARTGPTHFPPAHVVARVAGAPRRLIIPALGVDAPVVSVAAPGGTLVPPPDPMMLGWWAGGAQPGDAHGTTLIAGHTVHDGPATLNHLAEMLPGERLTVRTTGGVLRYRAVSVRDYPKGVLAAAARRLFAQSGPPRLVVVTCTDWDGTRYLSNTVVTARRVP